jgi:hypothetical protein
MRGAEQQQREYEGSRLQPGQLIAVYPLLPHE